MLHLALKIMILLLHKSYILTAQIRVYKQIWNCTFYAELHSKVAHVPVRPELKSDTAAAPGMMLGK